jgi:hypothetical protein
VAYSQWPRSHGAIVKALGSARVLNCQLSTGDRGRSSDRAGVTGFLDAEPTDRILTIDARVVHDAVQHRTFPHNRAGKRDCGGLRRGVG